MMVPRLRRGRLSVCRSRSNKSVAITWLRMVVFVAWQRSTAPLSMPIYLHIPAAGVMLERVVNSSKSQRRDSHDCPYLTCQYL